MQFGTDMMADSHLALAREIRLCEQRDRPFDPITDFPEAIRRIDVKLPVPSLEKSSTVLVDTPGLYSRMNFGYDTLTREFRSSAACAVFVVKTDNLFLEQVFEEFNQLLDLFSRIFLVINVDSSKRDLQSDGELGPSTESIHPEEIVEAFTTLSMAGPLRQAYEQGRVRIHALDLLNSASHRMSHPVPEPGQEEDPIGKPFDAFVEDLTEYLNSNDYTQEFMRDSLRQSHLLCREALDVVNGREIQDAFTRQEELGLRIANLDEKIAATERLLSIDWKSAFLKTTTENANEARAFAETESTTLAEEMRQALDRWYGSADSLKALEEHYWGPLLVHTALTIANATRTRLSSVLSTPFGGIDPTATMVTDLQRIGLSLNHIAAGALSTLHESDSIDPYLVKLDAERLPISRTFADWLLFRSTAKVRRLLFGEGLSQPIDQREKVRRLSNKTRLALLQIVHDEVQPRFASAPLETARERLQTYIDEFCDEVHSTLECQREQMRTLRSQLQNSYDLDAVFVLQLRALADTATDAIHTLDLVARRENVLPVATPEPKLLTAPFGTPQHAAA